MTPYSIDYDGRYDMMTTLLSEEQSDLQSLAFGYGYPFARLLVLKEMRYRLANLPPSHDTQENRHVLAELIADIANMIASSSISPRPFPSSVGDTILSISRRGDRLLYGASIDTSPDHVPVDETFEVTLHRTILEEVPRELFTYVTFYIMKMMPVVDKAIYDVVCSIFGCDRLVAATEQLTIPLRIPDGLILEDGSEPPSTVKYCLCLGFMRDTDEHPTLGMYSLSPTIVA